MNENYYNDEREEEDDGFEDCVPGGLRPNYKIPIMLCEMKEEIIDEIVESENNELNCAHCGFRFTSCQSLKSHFENCTGDSRNILQEYELSQYHTNVLIVALKNMYESGRSGLNPIKTNIRLPFHMEPFAGGHVDHHNRIVGNLAIVTCRMCKCQYIHRSSESMSEFCPSGIGIANASDDEQEIDPSLLKYHVKLCPEYQQAHDQFMSTMTPFVDKVRHHYDKLFEAYKTIRSGIYGSGFKTKTAADPFSWREMGTIYEVEETSRSSTFELEKASQPLCFRTFDFRLHNIEPENVDFIRTNYLNGLAETLDRIFFTRVTGL